MKFIAEKIRRKTLTLLLISVFSMPVLHGQTKKRSGAAAAPPPTKKSAVKSPAGKSGAPAVAGKKFALIIGNSEYQSSPLRNPVNDARLIGASLTDIGFQTTVEENLGLAAMRAALQNFAGKLPRGSVGLFYFAGHGMQIDGRNLLIPVDFDPAEQTDAARQALEVDAVIAALNGKSALNILILDACRNAPKGFAVAANKKGLAEIKNAPSGTYVAFATAPGKTAKDGAGSNSPYSQSLAANLRLRPSRIEDVFIRTRIQTDNLTGGVQTPWESSSLRAVFHFTEDNFAAPAAVFKSPVLESAGNLLQIPIVVPILNEAGESAGRISRTAAYFVEENLNLELAQIRGGRFLMGTSSSEVEAAFKDAKAHKDQADAESEEAEDEESEDEESSVAETEADRELKSIPAEMPQHSVNVPGFFISRTEVTQGQWQAAMGGLPSGIPAKMRGANLPVVNVSWKQAKEFCEKISTAGKKYRLPTEAEWEYAARGGTETAFAFGKTITSDLANFRGTSPFLAAAGGVFRNALVPVGSLKTFNGFGLADMHGNVWEWTEDNWHDDYDGAPTDGGARKAAAPKNTNDEDPRLFRVIRGGSWDSTASSCRSSHRRRQPQAIRSTKIGFRVVME